MWVSGPKFVLVTESCQTLRRHGWHLIFFIILAINWNEINWNYIQLFAQSLAGCPSKQQCHNNKDLVCSVHHCSPHPHTSQALGGCLLQEGASFLYAMSMGLPGTECVTQALCKAPGPCDLMEILNSPQSGPVLGSLLLVQFYTIYLKTKKKNYTTNF